VIFLLLWHVENRTLGPVFFRLVVLALRGGGIGGAWRITAFA
jgi:hypothetical protein